MYVYACVNLVLSDLHFDLMHNVYTAMALLWLIHLYECMSNSFSLPLYIQGIHVNEFSKCFRDIQTASAKSIAKNVLRFKIGSLPYELNQLIGDIDFATYLLKRFFLSCVTINVDHREIANHLLSQSWYLNSNFFY